MTPKVIFRGRGSVAGQNCRMTDPRIDPKLLQEIEGLVIGPRYRVIEYVLSKGLEALHNDGTRSFLALIGTPEAAESDNWSRKPLRLPHKLLAQIDALKKELGIDTRDRAVDALLRLGMGAVKRRSGCVYVDARTLGEINFGGRA